MLWRRESDREADDVKSLVFSEIMNTDFYSCKDNSRLCQLHCQKCGVGCNICSPKVFHPVTFKTQLELSEISGGLRAMVRSPGYTWTHL